MSKEAVPKALRPFAFHGLSFTLESGDDWLADCPFCHKENALSANSKTSQWVCHSDKVRCGRFGNSLTFLAQVADMAFKRTKRSDWQFLEFDRGILMEELKLRRVAYWALTDRWLIPVLGPRGTLHDLRTWVPGQKTKATAGMATGLWGCEKLKNAAKVWLCEGEWDGMSMEWLSRQVGSPSVVVAVPGARTFKPEWAELLLGKHVTVCGDNDEDGDVMAEKVWKELGGRRVDFVNWPETLPTKYDIRDFVTARRGEPKKAFVELQGLVSETHRRMPFGGRKDDAVVAITGERASERTGDSRVSLADVARAYESYLEMTPDMALAVEAMYAVHLSTLWPGDPLWLFVVGPPGSGKTELLLSVADAPDTVYQSSVDSRSLCSGFQTSTDPSLIPRLIGNCAIFKDWTELLESHPIDLQKTYAVLRGMYDGQLERSYGNSVSRKYKGTFNIIAGVTNKVHAHGSATVGERFIKLQLRKPSGKLRDAVLDAALMNVAREKVRTEAVRGLAAGFLQRRPEPPDPLRCLGEYKEKVKSLACLVALVRGDVQWSQVGYERELGYRPEAELPTRLVKQLTKLAMGACAVHGHSTVGPREWELVERVAVNTGYGYQMDVLQAVMTEGGRDVPLSDVEESASIPRFTLDRRIAGMEVLGLVNTRRVKTAAGPGASKIMVTVAPSIRRLWDDAGIKKDHPESAGVWAKGNDNAEGR